MADGFSKATRRGEVQNVRELSGAKGTRVQAEVCLGASVEHGYAVVRMESHSPAVLDALQALKKVLAEEALTLTKHIVRDQEEWERQRSQNTKQKVTS